MHESEFIFVTYVSELKQYAEGGMNGGQRCLSLSLSVSLFVFVNIFEILCE